MKEVRANEDEAMNNIILLIIEGMFNGAIVDLAEKPYIPQNILLQ